MPLTTRIAVNEHGAVKLLDFGTASLMAAGADVTSTAMRMLTPRYASPEQIRGERVSTATDVFSLGIVLYELLTGGVAIRRSGFPPERTWPRRRPAVAAAAKSRPARYESVSAFTADIRSFLGGRPVLAHGQTT